MVLGVFSERNAFEGAFDCLENGFSAGVSAIGVAVTAAAELSDDISSHMFDKFGDAAWVQTAGSNRENGFKSMPVLTEGKAFGIFFGEWFFDVFFDFHDFISGAFHFTDISGADMELIHAE